MRSEERQLCRCSVEVLVGFDEHLAEDVEEHVNDDAVACEFILSALTDACGLHLVDVFVVHTHQSEALAGSEFADAEFLALQLRGQFDCVLVCHIRFRCYNWSPFAIGVKRC